MENKILADQRRYQTIIYEGVKGITEKKDTDQILETFVSLVHKSIKITETIVYIHDKEYEVYRLFKSINGNVELLDKINEDSDLIRYFKKRNASVLLEEFKHQHHADDVPKKEITGFAQEMDAHVIVPLAHGGNLLGLLVLGAKRNGSHYTADDLIMFNAVAT